MATREVIVVGGGSAGLSAALVLGRQRRTVLLLDDGHPRNASTRAVHGFLSRDGIDPGELKRIACRELDAYASVEIRSDCVSGVRCGADGQGFVAVLAGGGEIHASKLLLATGLADQLPAVGGLEPLWGRSAFHCRHCDGWEARDQPVAVVSSQGEDQSSLAVVLTSLRRLTSDLVLCTNGLELEEVLTRLCAALRIAIRREPVASFAGTEDQLERIIFTHGEPLPRRAAFLSPPKRQRSDLAAQIGCNMLEDGAVEINEFGQTTVSGVYAAGDMARRPTMPFPYAQVILAAGFGVVAGTAIDLELLRESIARGVVT